VIRSIGDVVRNYKRVHRPRISEELRFYKMQKSLAKAIEKAALAKLPSGKRHPHQRRILGEVLQLAKNNLLRADLEDSKTFLQFHTRVKETIGHIKGIGELTIYDMALRIGTYLSLEPEHIYLHAGVRAGAKALGLNYRLYTLEKGRLPRGFHALKSYEIEDCLCIYKDDLRRVQKSEAGELEC